MESILEVKFFSKTCENLKFDKGICVSSQVANKKLIFTS